MTSQLFDLTVTMERVGAGPGLEWVTVSGRVLEPCLLAEPLLREPLGDSGMLVACLA